MPNQEIMREWVSRLRSGKYQQGRGALQIDGAFCCLGVLCQMAADAGVIDPPTYRRNGRYESISFVGELSIESVSGETCAWYDGATQMPSSTVYEWAGIASGPVIVTREFDSTYLYARKLAEMNDRGMTFAEIADVIEEHWIDLPEGTEVPDSPAAIEITEKEPANA